ncbi:type III secretion apparatus assembly protein SctX [Pseudochelatococcus sp. B33]
MVSEIKNLDIGVESISRWRIEDEAHLPEGGALAPAYLPVYRPLHDVLHRPTLDERLPELLQPATIDAELLQPAQLMEARIDTRTLLSEFAARSSGAQKATFDRAVALIDRNELLDEEVRASVAALYRG